MADLDLKDQCPFCHGPLEIVWLKLGLWGAATISTCPNCASAATTEPERPHLLQRGAKSGRAITLSSSPGQRGTQRRA